MSKDKRPSLAKKDGGASTGKGKQATSSPTVAPDRSASRLQHAESKPTLPKRIEDVSSLFGLGSSSRGGEACASAKSISLNIKKAKGSMKRLREVSEDGTVGKNSQKKRQKSSTVNALSSATASNTVTFEKKAYRQPKVTKRYDEEEDEEDIDLSKAVQAQTLNFLQNLSPKSRKVFWGLRDVAQGKLSAAAATTTATSSSPSLPSPSRAKAAKGSAKRTQKPADDGGELWRVGGPYIANDQDDDTDDTERKLGHTNDSESQDSTSSSEPSWMTDSSEEDDGGSNDEELESASVAAGATNQPSAAESSRRGGGGGRLFQGGCDGVWDDD
ncbi:hypothetical protein, conserved [Leishmania tarentolae]|uniref:Uncharacterized protein n=1 Tax=Leishmania tarentolae TaxID=5689 RepID=A0A640KVE3_LEITA|nr:hypothetical protein, conserved [Leishmania tarentolae]